MVPDVVSLKQNEQQFNPIIPLANINSATPSSGSLLSSSSPDSSSSSRSPLLRSPENRNYINNNGFQNYSNNHHQQNSQSTSSKNLNIFQLPITRVKSQLMKRLGQHKTLIIIGETGSGKTTQIPQFLLELLSSQRSTSTTNENRSMNACNMIGVTQPRRVAAVSLATRVAKESRTELGHLVGYKIRFEDCTTPKTKIKYMTDGILLREAIGDPLLSNYRVIVLDEAHERTVQSDVLLGIVKKAQRLRNNKRPIGDGHGDNDASTNQEESLKVVVMSATMDVDNFSKYFNNAPVYYVEGRLHPIEILYTEKRQNDYTTAALSTLFQIHQEEDESPMVDDGDNSTKSDQICYGGDVLVFCTGQEEIESMIKVVMDLQPQIKKLKTAKNAMVKTLKPYPLYSALPTIKQQAIFARNPNDCFRRVIFATNIAETSITIPNIRYVIDTGKFKSKIFSPKTGLEIMSIGNISKAQAMQRSGRAGRLAPGKCYRLYTRQEYKSFASFPVPEIQKCNLSSVLLQMIASGIHNVQEFDFIDRPATDSIEASISQLVKMKAIERPSSFLANQWKLTRIGNLIVSFPVDPPFALLIVMAAKFGCTEEIITIIAMLSIENIFIQNNQERDNAQAMHRKFASSEGDLIKLLKVFRKYKESKQSMQWCQENYLRPTQLKNATEIRQQLMDICRALNIPIVNCSNGEIVRKCLAIGAGVGVGLGANVALLHRDGDYRTVQFNRIKTAHHNNIEQSANVSPSQKVHIHPSSCLFSHSNKPECVMFVELVQTTKAYMRNVSLMDRDWLILEQA